MELSADELNLDLDDDIDGADPIEQQEIDLADLEQTIEMELLEPEDEDDAEQDEPEDVELALSDDGQDMDDDIDFSDAGEDDFSDIEQMLASDEDQEEGETEAAAGTETDEAGAVAADKKKAKKDKKAQKPEKAKKEKKKKEKKEKTVSAGASGAGRRLLKVILILVLVLVLIAGLTVGAYFLASSMGVSVPPMDKLPLIGTLLGKGGASIAGTEVVVVKSSLQNNFVTNAHAGKLLIITGSVTNRSSAPRRFVKVTASLASQGNPLAREVSAYCGNILAFEELSEQPMDVIQQRLANPSGDNNQNANIRAGATVPFMIVISDLPPDLVGYEVQVTEASPMA